VVTFATLPDLQLDVDYLHHTPYPEQHLVYTLNYTNAGHIDTTGVVITFAQPHYTTFDPSASGDWQDQGDGQYVYPVGALGYSESGTVTFAITMPAVTFTPAMTNFDAAAGIYDDGGSGKDYDLADNWQTLPQGVPDLVVENVEVNWATLLSGQLGQHVTVTVRNSGTAIGCNPIGSEPNETQCGYFYVDLYISPGMPPNSYPDDTNYGDAYSQDMIVAPGMTSTTVIASFTLPPRLPSPLYIRLDNGSIKRTFGDVPEYNEYNNVAGPIYVPYSVYLPLAASNYP